MKGILWLFAISVLMLVVVLAFTLGNRLVPHDSPPEVIKTFFSACNNGNYSLAGSLLVPETNRVLTRHIGAVDGGLRAICVSSWRTSTGPLHAPLCGWEYDGRQSGASFETLGLEDRAVEGEVGENHKAFRHNR